MFFIRFSTLLLTACLMPFSALAEQWGYSGETGPDHWGELDQAFETCQTGVNQSPINILPSAASKLGLPALSTQYSNSPTRLLNVNHTLQATMSSYTSDTLEIDHQPYSLKGFEFHAPSEHSIDGKTYAMELQLTHKNDNGDTVIMSVMFNVDEPNQAIQNLWESFPTMEDSSMPLFSPVDINQLIPEDKTYWRYNGSLTTPPCSEGIAWIILKTPVTLSAEQLDKFKYAMRHANNRPLQPLNGRIITDSHSGDTGIPY